MNVKRSLVLCVLMVVTASSIGVAGTLHFEDLGFRIDALEGKPGSLPYQVLSMYLPVSDSFAPNVNIQIQPYEGTLDEYVELSKQQISDLGWTMITATVSEDGYAVFEYAGKYEGYSLHWYARAASSPGRIYLVTATATETQWPRVSKKLIAAVDSFKLD